MTFTNRPFGDKKRTYPPKDAPEVEADVKNYKSAAEAARDIGRGIAAMRQTHRGPMLLVVQVLSSHGCQGRRPLHASHVTALHDIDNFLAVAKDTS